MKFPKTKKLGVVRNELSSQLTKSLSKSASAVLCEMKVSGDSQEWKSFTAADQTAGTAIHKFVALGEKAQFKQKLTNLTTLILLKRCRNGGLAQLGERDFCKVQVGNSNFPSSTNLTMERHISVEWHVAATCLRNRGLMGLGVWWAAHFPCKKIEGFDSH